MALDYRELDSENSNEQLGMEMIHQPVHTSAILLCYCLHQITNSSIREYGITEVQIDSLLGKS